MSVPDPGNSNYMIIGINVDVQITVALVKTGPITSGGVIRGEVGEWAFTSPNWPKIKMASLVIGNSALIDMTVPTCTVTNKQIQANLGTVATSAFRGVNSTAGNAPFKISLNCSGGASNTVTDAYVTLTDFTNPSNRSDVLSLTKNSTASGIGIQLLRGDGTVIRYGADSSTLGNANQWLAQSGIGNQTVDIPLSARYIQTASTINPGAIANGQATFTMSYP